MPLPFDAVNLDSSRFRWAGDEWIAERRSLVEPRLTLFAAARLSPFVAPFEDTARQGLGWLLLSGAAGLAAALIISARMTSELRHLAAHAAAVAV